MYFVLEGGVGGGGGALNITIVCNGRLYVMNRDVLCLQAAEELQSLRDHHTQEANHLMKQNSQKIYQELINKGKLALAAGLSPFFLWIMFGLVSLVAVGLSESEKEAILERHMADVALQQEAREEERRRQRDLLEVSNLR